MNRHLPPDLTPSHIYWFAYYNPDSPSTRYRGKYLLEEIQARRGISYSFVFPGYAPANILWFLRVFFNALLFRKKGSVIVFQKIHTRRLYGTALRILLFFQRKNTLYDLDDAEHIRFPRGATNHFLKNCTATVTGSEALLTYAQSLSPKVWQATSPILRHQQEKSRRNSRLDMVWIGFYNAHQENLKTLIFPALEQLDFPIKLTLLGVNRPHQREELLHRFAALDHVELEIPEDINWLDETEVYQRIVRADLGLAPLLDTEINRCKSAFKLKQYLSCGLPVLSSPVGENQLFLNPQVNGLFCENAHDFAKGVRFFAEMEDEAYWNYSAEALRSSEVFRMEEVAGHFWAQLCASLKEAEQPRPRVLQQQ